MCVFVQGSSSAQSKISTASYGRYLAILWFHYVAVAAEDKNIFGIKDNHHCFESSKIAILSPLFGKLDHAFEQIPFFVFQNIFKHIKKIKGIGSTAGKAG